MIIRYDSIAALRQAYLDAGLRGKQGVYGGSDWFNNESEADSLRLALTGDTSLVQRAEAILWQFEQQIETPKPEWHRSVAGPMVNVPDVLAGRPTCMRRLAPALNDHSPIEIFVVTNSAGGLSAQILRNRGIAILALVLALSRVRPLMLYQVAMGNGSRDGTGETLLISHINTTPLDLATACYVLTSAGFARRITYELSKKLNGYSYSPPEAFSYNRPEVYELGMIKRIAINPERSILIGRSNKSDPIITMPIAWVRTQVERFTKEQEALVQ
jgi:hypothetical protein